MYERILVPVDGRPASERALDEAVRLASGTGAALVIVAVSSGFVGAMELASTPAFRDSSIPALATTTELVESAAARARAAGVSCEEAVVDSAGRSVAETLLDEADAWHCDLVVMGIPGRRARSLTALGNEAESVLRQARIPVLLVHAATTQRARGRWRSRLHAAEPMVAGRPSWREPRPAR